MNEFEILGRKIGPDHAPLVIAEIGINHEGSLETAKAMVDAAQRAGIGALYFAKIDRLLNERSFNTKYTVPYITEGAINLDIDTEEDWEYAEQIALTMGRTQ